MPMITSKLIKRPILLIIEDPNADIANVDNDGIEDWYCFIRIREF